MDFIKEKIVARSLVASIVPGSIYTSVWVLSKIVGSSSFDFLNIYALLVLSATSFIYPINHIGLFLLFQPLDMLWEYMIKSARQKDGKDKKPNPILLGNFGPVNREQSYKVAKITGGKIPEDINGVYLRNGPEAKHIPENDSHHWFDGDAMIHAMRIKEGKLFYCNRWLQCDRMKLEDEAGKAVITRVGEMAYKGGLFKMIMSQLKNVCGYGPSINRLTISSPNTAMTHHQKQTYALVESNLPFKIKLDSQKESFDIKSIGCDDFNGQLTHNVSAHPKVIATTGEFMAFGYDMQKPMVHYSLFDSQRKLLNTMDIPITSMRMIHDFPATENYIIIPDLPLEFKPDVAVKEGGSVFVYDIKQDSRYGVMHKMNDQPNKIKWFTLPNHYVFHYANSWEEMNAQGQLTINMYGCAQETVDISLEKDHPFFEDENFRIKFTKFTLNMVTGEGDMKYIVDEISMEFPLINQQYVGIKNRYTYIAYLFQKLPQDKVGQENLYFQGFVKYDLQEHKIVKKMNFGDTKTSGEVFFSPRDNATEEDDGYCMAFVYDWKTEKTEFVMWDAKTMNETPYLQAETTVRVPNGFHSFFVPQSQML